VTETRIIETKHDRRALRTQSYLDSKFTTVVYFFALFASSRFLKGFLWTLKKSKKASVSSSKASVRTRPPGDEGHSARVAEMYGEIFSGIEADTEKLFVPMAGESHDEMVMIRDIPFFSVCEHHLLPFFGKAPHRLHSGGGKIVGISALAKALEVLAKRPQVQERLTAQFAT